MEKSMQADKGKSYEIPYFTYTEIMTILTDIEAIINSRFLTYIGDDIKVYMK